MDRRDSQLTLQTFTQTAVKVLSPVSSTVLPQQVSAARFNAAGPPRENVPHQVQQGSFQRESQSCPSENHDAPVSSLLRLLRSLFLPT